MSESLRKKSLDSRVLDGKELCRSIAVPRAAGVHKCTGIGHGDGNLGLSLHELHGEALRCVPRDVAMCQPRSWVIFLKGNSEVPVGWERCNVTARRVGEVPVGVGSVEDGGLLADDPEIVSVQMDWMSDSEAGVVLNDPNSPDISGGCNAERVDVVIRGPDGFVVEDF